ncbi:MAG: DUF4153 domain-containing protein [Marinobacter sp.]|uniref:DUF4153 domain-containing protein n=1 Tax=Marinobacter sp. TaxID=50741 RepID=UPI00299E19F5|nr:DUF4153 domain-containing protein [Marinobacter sp.]MDX1757745.1 DUF4153 domain-containing protein [Marinobacter sp.]
MNPAAEFRLAPELRYGLIVLALIQGFALYFLHLAVDHEHWPATDPRWMFLFYSVAVGVPLFYYLGLERLDDRRNGWVLVPLAAMLSFVGWHLGWLSWAGDLPLPRDPYFTFALVVSIGVALFILALYFRVWCINRQARFEYRQLLELSWQNALILAQLSLFLTVFWGLLFLWSGLFKVIGVDFFEELFEEPLFVYPVTALVGGWGLVLVRERIRLIATVQSMCEALIRALLPLAALIMLLFLAALPLTGLEKIWNTGQAALLMMWLALVLLFFFNAALGGEPDRPAYPPWLLALVLLAVALLPLLSLLAAWALGLRIEQYGLTVDRLWAATIQLLVAGFTVSYSVLVIWKRGRVVPAIQGANKTLALLVAGVLLLVNTPVADMRAWAASSQANRLLTGAVSEEEFDYGYLRFELGAYGVRELRRLQGSDMAVQNSLMGDRIGAILKQKNRGLQVAVVDPGDTVAIAEMLAVIPHDAVIPDALLKRIARDELACLAMPRQCTVIRARPDAATTYWLVATRPIRNHVFGPVYLERQPISVLLGSFSGSGCLESEHFELTGDEQLQPVGRHTDVFTDGECFFQVTPKNDYLRGLLAKPAQ